MTTHEAIIKRVLDAVPARSYAMNALLSLIRIEITSTVATAAVSCERTPVLMINPDFVAERCRTDEHLFLLVMHELHHVLLGHTRLFPRPTPTHNVAFDAVINALLVSRFPQHAYTSFFTGIYGEQTGPLRLLAPPGDPPLEDPSLRAAHEALYGSGDVTSQEVFDLITRHAAGTAIDMGQLLGAHGVEEDEWGTDSHASDAFIGVIRSIVEKWPPPDEPVRGRSLADLLTNEQVTPRSPREQVRAAVRAALSAAASRPGLARPAGHGRQRIESPVPDLRDRRAAVLRSLGPPPLLNAADVPTRRRSAGRAEVYVDVSGSLNTFLPVLFGALRSLRAYIAPRVHLFSTVVATADLSRVCSGEVRTTGGTDIKCVLEHVAMTRPKKALVITDGYVGTPAPTLAAAAQACSDIRVLLTPGGWRADLESLASRIDELPVLEVKP
jgi:hypothetical protein